MVAGSLFYFASLWHSGTQIKCQCERVLLLLSREYSIYAAFLRF
jgi:hypothetical protein